MDNGADAFYRAAITTVVVGTVALIAGAPFTATTAIATCAVGLVVGCLRG
jgi:hypothetical protein